jgi:hypothetical protein
LGTLGSRQAGDSGNPSEAQTMNLIALYYADVCYLIPTVYCEHVECDCEEQCPPHRIGIQFLFWELMLEF